MGTVKTISPSTDILDIFTGIVPFHPRMKQILLLISLTVVVQVVCGEDEEGRQVRNLNVFNVVSFPNSECAAVSGYNGTCYTASECSSLGGSASGTCASSFGVCCVFSIACGSSSSANNSYAVISSYSTSTDSDPCTYTFCKTNTDVCKLRIDFDTMVLSAPSGVTTPADTAQVYADSVTVGDCTVDSLTVSNPGGPIPPTAHRICGSFFSISPTTGHSTLCSFAVPFKVGVHFDADDAICDIGDAAAARDSCENDKSTGAAPVGAGYGYSGFYLAYWQNSC